MTTAFDSLYCHKATAPLSGMSSELGRVTMSKIPLHSSIPNVFSMATSFAHMEGAEPPLKKLRSEPRLTADPPLQSKVQEEAIKLLIEKRKRKEERKRSRMSLARPEATSLRSCSVVSTLTVGSECSTADLNDVAIEGNDIGIDCSASTMIQDRTTAVPSLPAFPAHLSVTVAGVTMNEKQPEEEENLKPSLLHTFCAYDGKSSDLLRTILTCDADATRRRGVVAESTKVEDDEEEDNGEDTECQQKFGRKRRASVGLVRRQRRAASYPLHLALSHGPDCSADAVRTLTSAAPEVLRLRDGDGRTPLSVALAHRAPREVVLRLLYGDPEAARIADRRLNLPIHLACAGPYDIEVIKALAGAYPEDAMGARDFYGRTALDVAQTSGIWRVNDEVIDYLQGLVFDRLEREALHI